MGASRRVQGVKTGTLHLFAMVAGEPGYLLCDGSAYNVADKPRLFAKIGYAHGGAGPVFNVPEIRGEALVGLDLGRGVDPGRVIGSAQAGQSNNIRNLVTGLVADSTMDTGEFPEDGSYTPFWTLTGDEGANPNFHVKGRLWGRPTRMPNVAFPVAIKD